MNKTAKTVLFWVAIALSSFLLWTIVKSGSSSQLPEISYSAFLSQVEAGNVAKVRLSNIEAVGTRKDGTTFHTNIPQSQEGLLQTLHQKNVDIWVRRSEDAPWSNWVLNLILPIAILAGLWFYMLRRMKYSPIWLNSNLREGTRPPDIG